MKKIHLALAIVAGAAVGAHADWLLNTYSTVAPDSAAVNATYGIQSFGNPASATTVSVAAPGGAVSLIASKIASDGTKGYTANVGMLHPLTSSWAVGNVSTVTAVTFDVRFSAKPLDGFEVALASDEYPKVYADGGKTYTKKFLSGALPAVGVWKSMTIDPTEFIPPDWFCIPDDKDKPCPVDFPTLTTVLSKLKAIQFAPKVKYSAAGTQDGTACTACVTPTQTAITVDIRNVKFVGVDAIPYVNPTKIGCEPTGKHYLLDNFVAGANQNAQGGYWFAMDDRDTSGKRKEDTAVGSSKAAVEFVAGDETLGESGLAKLTVKLDKSRPGAIYSPAYHKYAGWGAIGTGFYKEGVGDMKGMTAIEFVLKANVLSPLVDGINFKVPLKGVDPAHTHAVMIPTAQVKDATVTSVCVRPSDLAQPSWLDPKLKTAFDASLIQQLAWEVKIADQKTSTIVTDTAAYTLTDIKVWGIEDIPLSVMNKAAQKSFGASYKNGVLSLKGLAGFKTVDVISVTGKKVASIVPSAATSITLDRGTYVLAARGEGKSLTRKLAVVSK